MEALLAIMLKNLDYAVKQIRLYEENSDECKLSNEYEFAFTNGWAEAMDYMVYVVKGLMNGDEEDF